MNMLDQEVRTLLNSIAYDDAIQSVRPEYVQAAREILQTEERELEERADYHLAKAKPAGTA